METLLKYRITLVVLIMAIALIFIPNFFNETYHDRLLMALNLKHFHIPATPTEPEVIDLSSARQKALDQWDSQEQLLSQWMVRLK